MTRGRIRYKLLVMMIRIFILIFFSISLAYAQVGEIRTVRMATDGWIMRSGTKLNLKAGMKLEKGDNIHTENSLVALVLYPKIQICMVKGSELTLTQHLLEENGEKTTSLIDFIRGLIRIQVTKDGKEKVDQKVSTKLATFAVRGTEYEVSITDEVAELDVVEGEVEATSPYVKTFVPEIVKPNNGLTFNRKDGQYTHRAARERVKDNDFLSREMIRERWEKTKPEKKRVNGPKRVDNVKERVEKMLEHKEQSDDE